MCFFHGYFSRCKKALWDRLNQAVQRHEHELMFSAANQLYRDEQVHKVWFHNQLLEHQQQKSAVFMS